MAIVTHKDISDDIRAIVIAERLDLAGTESIEPSFAALVKAAIKHVIVDIGEVTFLSSVAIRMIIASAKALHASGGRMALVVGANDAATRTLKTTCVDAIIPLFETIPAAEDALTS